MRILFMPPYIKPVFGGVAAHVTLLHDSLVYGLLVLVQVALLSEGLFAVPAGVCDTIMDRLLVSCEMILFCGLVITLVAV